VLVVGLILVIIGVAVLYFIPDRWARFAGGVLLVLGLILVLIGVLNIADVNLSEDAEGAVLAFVRSSWG
jgi:uncharacterized membrane protein YfcA